MWGAEDSLESGSSEKRLVVFDVEGVLLPKNRYLVLEVGRRLGSIRFVKLLFFGFLYELRLLSLESALKRIFRLLQGTSVEELLTAFRNVPLLPHTEQVFARIRNKGLKVALVSSGLPQIVVEDLASRLAADYAYGPEVEMDNGLLTGAIGGEIITKNGKALIVNKILTLEGLTKRNCIVVADDRNNAPIFYPESLKIGYNPDLVIVWKSDYAVKRSLLDVESIIEGMRRQRRSISGNEVVRETIHACGLLAALAAMHFGVYPIALFLFLTMLVYIASELVRMEGMAVPLLSSITLNATTDSERYEFATTPVLLALGVILSLLLFPAPMNYTAVAIVCLGDSAASIFGKLFGRTRIPFNKMKNLEGSVAGLFFAFLGASVFLAPLQALVGAIAGMIVESLPLPVNDNLSTPLVTGALLTLFFVVPS
jgi:HAD superfamily phosphoserine phosphatase-like hydrolase